MLTILNCNPTGFFSYGLHRSVWLDSLGLILLEGKNNDRTGNPNGAGKTSLFNAITTILFDQNPVGFSGESIVNETLGKCFGKVGFCDSNGGKWRVIVTRKWRKTDKYPDPEFEEPSEWHNHKERYSGTDVYLERWDDSLQLWKDERGTNVAGNTRLDLKSTRKKIITVLGINYEQFMSVGYLAQQQSLRFVNGTHKERLEVIAELGDIGIWDERRNKIKDRIKEIDSEIERSNAVIAGANRAGAILQPPDPKTRESFIQLASGVQQSIDDCDARIVAVQAKKIDWVTQCQTIDNAISVFRQESRDLTAQRKALELDASKLVKAYAEECNVVRSRPKDQALNQLEDDMRQNRGYVTARRHDLEQLLSGAGKCPRCKTSVTDDHLLRQRELILIEIRELEEKIQKAAEEIKFAHEEWEYGVQNDLKLAEDKYTSARSSLEATIGIVDSAIVGVDNKTDKLRLDKQSLGQDPEYQIQAIAQERMGYIASLSQYGERVKDWDRQQLKWAEYKLSLETTKLNIEKLEDELKYLRILERLFGDKGIKAHKLGVVIAQLNQTAQKFLDILTDNTVRVWVTPFREKSDGGVSTDIQIMVQEGTKSNVPFGLYSGGEKQQIVLAFIGAFWQVATMQGSGVNLLCLDEIFGPIDEQNAIGVYHYLDYIKSQGKSTIIVVTHNQDVKHQLNFDNKWLVEKTNHTSTLTTTT